MTYEVDIRWLETLADPQEFAYSVMRMIEDLMHGIEKCLTAFQHGLEMCLNDSAYYDAMAEEDRESFYRESYYPRD